MGDCGCYRWIKVIESRDKRKKPNLPYVSNKPNDTYVIMKNEQFVQLRKYGQDRFPLYDIDYTIHRQELYLHMHMFKNGKRLSGDNVIPLTIDDYYYKKHKNLFKGVRI